MLADVIDALVCPTCSADLALVGSAIRCGSGHSFDLARQGYVNLLAGSAPPGTADTQQMVQARETFLGAGHFQPLAQRLAVSASSAAKAGLVIDAGAGIGYYLRVVLDAIPAANGLALDISKFALRRAARAHPRIGAVVWDIWRPLPVRSGAAQLIINVFSPRNGAEFKRILRADGALLVVTPTAEHLQELVKPLGLLCVDARKEERLQESLAEHFQLEERELLAYELHLPHADAKTAIAMGPSAHHLAPGALQQAIAQLPEPLTVTASFTLSRYRPVG